MPVFMIFVENWNSVLTLILVVTRIHIYIGGLACV